MNPSCMYSIIMLNEIRCTCTLYINKYIINEKGENVAIYVLHQVKIDIKRCQCSLVIYFLRTKFSKYVRR